MRNASVETECGLKLAKVGQLETGMFAGRIGIVLGNGPQIDSLSDATLRAFEDPRFVVCGVTRICASRRLWEADYAPDLHLIWDPCCAPLGELDRLLVAGLEWCAHRTLRIYPAPRSVRAYPADVFVQFDEKDRGPIEHGVKLRASVSDAAVNLLWRLGVRDVYLFGVQMHTPGHCALVGRDVEPEHERGPWPSEITVSQHCWNYAQMERELFGLRCFCAASDSELVMRGVMPCAWPAGVPE